MPLLFALRGTQARRANKSRGDAPVTKHSREREYTLQAKFGNTTRVHERQPEALGDPIEVGALLAVLEDDREAPLPHTSAGAPMWARAGGSGG